MLYEPKDFISFLYWFDITFLAHYLILKLGSATTSHINAKFAKFLYKNP